MKNKNLILGILGIICLVLAGAVVYTAFIRQPEAEEADAQPAEQSGGRYITYNGKEYRRDQNVQAMLLMGVDAESTAQVGVQTGDAGQADSLNLLILNNEEKTAKILQISRDSAVDIDVYDESGRKVMSTEGQICLQYAFGDSREKSCRLTVQKAEELLGGIDIDSYLALTLDGIRAAVDAAGGDPYHCAGGLYLDRSGFSGGCFPDTERGAGGKICQEQGLGGAGQQPAENGAAVSVYAGTSVHAGGGELQHTGDDRALPADGTLYDDKSFGRGAYGAGGLFVPGRDRNSARRGDRA